jgi:hypothetical protein
MGTEHTTIKTYKFIFGLCAFLFGAILWITLEGSVRYTGLVIILGAIIYLSSVLYGFFFQSDPNKFKSQAREEILRHSIKKNK